MQKDEFYDELATLDRWRKRSDVVSAAGTVNAQFGKLIIPEVCLSERCTLLVCVYITGMGFPRTARTMVCSCFARIFNAIRIGQQRGTLTPQVL